MTDVVSINGTPIPTEAVPGPMRGIVVTQIQIDLEPSQSVFEMKIRGPGIVRAAGFWLKTPSVIGSANLRAVEKIAMPILFVECDPAGEMIDRVFLFLPSNRPFAPREGFMAVYRASAIGAAGAMHVFEIVAAS